VVRALRFYDIERIRTIARLELGKDGIPDETALLNFCGLLEAHQLSDIVFEEVNVYLERQEIKLSQTSMVDAVVIHSPSSACKGSQYSFGLTIHRGTDVNSHAIHRKI
jgi:transposase, IS5 family